MVYSDPSPLDATFGALADPTRRAILMRLSGGERSIGELAAQFDMTLPGVSKHVRVLESAGLTEIRREGRVRRCRLVGAPLRDAQAWIVKYQAFWEEQLDQFAAYLAATPEEAPACPPTTLPSSPTSSSSGAPSRRPPNAPSARGRNRRR
jgi:DNA-binding transcriptional ArsR family regulator